MAYDAFERGRYVAVGLGEIGRIFLENCAHGIDGGIAVKGAFAGKHFVKDGPERENVGARVGGLAAGLLGRHVADRAHHHSSFGAHLLRGFIAGRIRLRAGNLGQAEVENLGAAVVGDEQILRLQVAMHDAFFVRGGKSPGNLLRVLDRFTGSERPVP